MRKFTNEEYVKWIEENRPDYEVLEKYVNVSTKILHRHKASGKKWRITPEKFKAGRSHPEISRNNNSVAKRTHEEYLEWVQRNRPEFEVIGKYVNVKTHILHRHIATGILWNCRPEKFIAGQNPTELSGSERHTHEKYLQYIKNNKIQIEPIKPFVNQSTILEHRCLLTGDIFKITPQTVLRNKHFKYRRKIYNTETYKQWLNNNRPELVITEPYITSQTEINHLHVDTGECWKVRPNNVQQGQRHPCEHLPYSSRKCITWLSMLEENDDISIQHILNGGEHKINGVGKVDGYCEDTNTVYEFYGDLWHGNPEIFDPEDTNPVNYIKFGELFEKTIEREHKIKNLGYSLVSIWEKDFNELLKPNC